MPRLRLSLAAALTLVTTLPTLAHADAMTEAKRRDIQTLMGVLDMDQMRRGLAAQMANALANNTVSKMGKASRTEQNKTGQLVGEESLAIMKASDSLLASRQVEIIGNAFTADEVRQLVAFYQSPLGKKTQTALPSVLEQSMQASQQWAQGLGPQIERRVIARAARDRALLPQPDGKLAIPPADAVAAPAPAAKPRR